jgi:glycosyltransferase involved in cell wall biosynthesis
MMTYSVVVPLYNEQDNVMPLYTRLTAVMENTESSYELIFIDDGSIDATFRLLSEISSVDQRVVVLRLRRNFGQTAALAAGFDHATGDYVIAMDGDLQDQPEDIPRLLEKLKEGYDIVSGWRTREENLLLRRIPSRCANWLMAKLSGVPIHDFGTTFKVYRRDLLVQVPLYAQFHRFIPALASSFSASICEVPVEQKRRTSGKSHYGIGRIFPVLLDLITIRFLLQYLTRPMHLFGSLGLVGISCGLVLAGILAYVKFVHQVAILEHHGPALLFASVLFLGGIQLLAIGLLGELQVRHYHQGAGRRTLYMIKNILRSSTEGVTKPTE